YSSNCNTLGLSGDMDLGAHSQCCGGPAPTDDTISWKNQASGASGAAGVFVSVCSAFGISVLCNPHWTATVPLVIGNNRITIDIVDSAGDKGEAVLNVNKAAVGYTVSGKVTSVAGISPSPLSFPPLNMNWTGGAPLPVTQLQPDGTFAQ